jgi:hypothetical protein
VEVRLVAERLQPEERTLVHEVEAVIEPQEGVRHG